MDVHMRRRNHTKSHPQFLLLHAPLNAILPFLATQIPMLHETLALFALTTVFVGFRCAMSKYHFENAIAITTEPVFSRSPMPCISQLPLL